MIWVSKIALGVVRMRRQAAQGPLHDAMLCWSSLWAAVFPGRHDKGIPVHLEYFRSSELQQRVKSEEASSGHPVLARGDGNSGYITTSRISEDF